MKPGDMIEWVYKFNNIVVDEGEILWSSSMQQWVPIGGVALLISITEDEYVWLSEKGLFLSRADDTWGDRPTATVRRVVPRAR